MLKKTFIIATTGDRAESLFRLLDSLLPWFMRGWEAVVVAQKYSKDAIAEIWKYPGVRVEPFNTLIGAHSAKVWALTVAKSDIWCSLDDDMEAIPGLTDFDKMAELICYNPSYGFISGNWAKTEKQARAKGAGGGLVKQKLVYTGGGLVFCDDVAEIIRGIPNEQYYFDDCLWAVCAYIHGYDNYRFRGSILVHRICTGGGRKTWKKENKATKVFPPKELLTVRYGKKLPLICMDKDVTEYADELHRKEATKWASK